MESMHITKNIPKRKNYKNIYCGNCGNKGHTYKNCKEAITSLGIITYKINSNNQNEYLLIRRKDTIGFVEFMRGKYSIHGSEYIKNLFSEMTKQEVYNIVNFPFDVLWNNLWLDQKSKQYKNEYLKSKEKFYEIKNNNKLQNIIKEIKYFWEETEWGFPKGRRNLRESDINCAKREFSEETGINNRNINILTNIKPIEEKFMGSNNIEYKHIYYIASCNTDINLRIDNNNIIQKSEVSNIGWFNYENAIKILRPYHIQKKRVLKVIDGIIREYLLNIKSLDEKILNMDENIESKYIMLI
jgi:8-oxo-dGTP pyrophosphatase MutT (NUDIX family)